MQCPQCHAENREGSRFCAECGAPLTIACPDCGFANYPDAKFCGGCGKTLATTVVSPADSALKRESPEPEHRQLTVMFCDLVGSTTLAERLDPEKLHVLLAQYQDTCAEVIRRYEGHIARYVGDGLLVYFGYPQAHEDDAERGVRAGLGIVDAIRELEAKIGDSNVKLAVRIGITTGLVVAGDIGTGERVEEKAIVGQTPNVAARLQAIAKPNTVVIGASTQRLVEGLFDCDALGAQNLKGISQAVSAYRVRAESGAPSRFEAKAVRGLTPLVGREEEIGLLLKRWSEARDGEGQVALLSGEVGIGKSRIVRGFRDCLEAEAHNRVLYYGSPYHQNSAFYPAIDQLERALRFKKEDTPAQKFEKLKTVLSDLGLPIAEHAPYLASLLAVPLDSHYPTAELDPQQLKKKTIETIVTIVCAMSAQQPVLMVVEDAHWIDPSTLELISLLIERLPCWRLLLLVTYRPEFELPWRAHTHITLVTLNRLSRKESAAMIAKVTRGKSIPDEIRDQIVDKTDGVPLFVEELTKIVLESEPLKDAGDRYVLSGPLSSLTIPTSLQDSLMARLDRLGAVKEVAQLAATLGRTFSYDLVTAVSPLAEKELQDALAKLVQAELIYRRGLPPAPSYEFKHALVQDTAYQSLLKSTRQHHHQRIAHVLEEKFPETAESESELLAHHCFQGEVWDKAVAYFRQAGTKAAARSAYREAVTCFEQALGALTHLPESRETLEHGIDLRLDLRNSLHPLGEHQRLFDHLCEAEPLAERIDDQRRLGWISAYMATYFAMSGDPDRAAQSGQRALAIAKTLGELPLQVAANFRLGLAYLTCDYRRASEFFRRNVEALQGELIRERFGEAGPASVLSRFWLVPSLAELGEFAEGITRGEEAVQIAETVDQPWSLIGAYYSVGYLYLRKGDLDKAIPVLERGLGLSQDYPLFWLPWVASSLGYALALSGRGAEALPLLEQGIEQAASKRQWRFYALQAAYLSEAYWRSNRMDDAIRLATHALDSARDYKARGQEAWALWNLGEIAAHHEPPEVEKAEEHYCQAMALAEELGMRPLVAHCHRGLGHVYRRTENLKKADEQLSKAVRLFREMDMRSWLEKAEQELST